MLSIVRFGFSQKKELKGSIADGVDSFADIKSCLIFFFFKYHDTDAEGRNTGESNFQHHKHKWFVSNLMSVDSN